MDDIIGGLLKLQHESFPARVELFKQLAHHQSLKTLFITYSDSRVIPELLTQSKLGELFVIRNAGNIAIVMLGQGMRSDEVFRMTYSNLDFFNRTSLIVRGKTKNAKRTLSMCQEVFELLKKRRQSHPNDYGVFPSALFPCVIDRRRVPRRSDEG